MSEPSEGKPKRDRGEGSIFRDRYKDKATGEWKTCETWSIKYYWLGKPKKESTGSTRRADAVKLLNKRKAEMARGRLIGPDLEKVMYENLRAMLLNDYTVNGRRSLDRVEDAVAHLDGFFALRRALAITGDRVTAYVAHRKAEGARNATCNRELAALKRMFRLGEQAGKVAQRPHIAMLEERNTRSGFFEEPDFRAVLSHLPDDLKPVAEVAYLTGWRVKSELLTRQWSHVDFTHGWLRLEPGETKNGEGRMFPLTPQLRTVLERQRERTDTVARATGAIVPWVFHRAGRRIKHFRRAWLTALLQAGLAQLVSEQPRVVRPLRVPHDFRRTGVRNLERAGVPRSAAMKMVGHKTESIYRRYAIVDEAMLKDSAEKLGAYHAAASEAPRKVVALAPTVRVQSESGR